MNQTPDSKLYPVYSLDMVNFLTIEKKHKIKGIKDNANDATGYYKAVLFRRTQKLLDDVAEFKRLKK